jgi:Zn-dependent protease
MSTTTTEIMRSVRPGPVFLAVVAATALGGALLWTSGRDNDAVAVVGALLLVVGGWVISLSLHEFGHAVTAFKFGDRGAELRGYLTLNPLKYAHPGLSIGLPLVIILLGGIGFPGGAVYVNKSGFTKVQRSVVSAAGPFANIVIAVVLLLIISGRDNASLIGELNFWSSLAMLALLQITAAVLNLLPIPGLDGYGIVEPYLSDDTSRSVAPIAPFGFLLIFVILLVPQFNRAFFDAVYWLFELSGVSSFLASWGWDLFVFWK